MLQWQIFASLFYPEHPRNHKGLELASFFCTREVSERKGPREFIPEKELCQLMRGGNGERESRGWGGSPF